MANKETYSILDDTFNGEILTSELYKELKASSLSSLVAYIDVDTDSDIIDIHFSVALDSGQKTTLDGIISAHTAQELSSDYIEVYNHMNLNSFSIYNKYEVPKDVNYDVLGLYKKVTMVDGDITEVIYYGSYDGETYSSENKIYCTV